MKSGFFLVILFACYEKVTVTSSDAMVNCDVFEYYDIRDGACKHCDTACFERVNSTYIQFVESGCQEFCPGYMGQYQSAAHSLSDDNMIGLSMMEGGMMGFIAALVIVSVIIVVIWRRETVRSLKGCCRRARGGKRLSFLVAADNDDDFGETSYVSLSDPLDEVEMVYRVTCV